MRRGRIIKKCIDNAARAGVLLNGPSLTGHNVNKQTVKVGNSTQPN